MFCLCGLDTVPNKESLAIREQPEQGVMLYHDWPLESRCQWLSQVETGKSGHVLCLWHGKDEKCPSEKGECCGWGVVGGTELASPKACCNQEMRCLIFPWYNWCRMSGVMDQKILMKGRYRQNGCWIGFMLTSWQALEKAAGVSTILSSASRTGPSLRGLVADSGLPISSRGAGHVGHSAVLVQVTRTCSG